MPAINQASSKTRNKLSLISSQAQTADQKGQIQDLMERGIIFHRAGMLKHAQDIYEQTLIAQPDHVDAMHLLGLIAYQTANFDLAEHLIEGAIALNPNNASYHSNLGNVLKAVQKYDAAILSYDKAIELKPDFTYTYYNRGNALHVQRKLEDAIESFDQAITLSPDFAEAYNNRGNALKDLKRLDAAIASYDAAIQVKPDYADAYNNRGNALKDLKRLDAAIASYDAAIQIKPDYAQAYNNRGNALEQLKKIDEAIVDYSHAIELKPDFFEAFNNRGNALKEKKQLSAAIASYNRAIELKPDYAEAYWNKSLAYLLGGDYINGWKFYEWRWQREVFAALKRDFPQPLWLGTPSLLNKSILLHGEQGFGDTIQFFRFAKLVSDLGAKVILEVQKPLFNLLADLDGGITLTYRGESHPEFDFHCPLMSLPHAFKTTVDTIPTRNPYIFSKPAKVAIWETKLGGRIKPRVGIAWSGNVNHKNDHNRSISLKQLLLYLPDNCQYVSLQKGLSLADGKVLHDTPQILNFAHDLYDFSDTAALTELLDCIISVDTSVAHLAAAMGKETWILLPNDPDWRWLLDREDSPWYPTVKLYRQPVPGDWFTVLSKVRDGLLALK
ncbi:tetratricopeptide repeat protein [Polynucleobacter sp. JS-Mosq-20-D10]|uniref:tetratricopeptide repeat protein n=1 Tax=Polynucleobacter sp. JS-Mosq-20-D10 TaxID=2576922 RepID=UPI001BFED89A|nr:tetratricopeptide repeat protein [Polynucleobacter sp. JS-Mosq-20-D10]QWE00906.1 tetratricopeptide repeat protein [Polynucleobacter sp. JS-Mosq-20-D10]